MDENKLPGGTIERGMITAKSGDTYRVKSYDRSGVVTPFIPSLFSFSLSSRCGNPYCSRACEEKYNPGDKVIFTLFEDGTGFILRKMPE